MEEDLLLRKQVQCTECVVSTVDCGRGEREGKVSCGLTLEWLTISGWGRLFDRPRRRDRERKKEGGLHRCVLRSEGKPQSDTHTYALNNQYSPSRLLWQRILRQSANCDHRGPKLQVYTVKSSIILKFPYCDNFLWVPAVTITDKDCTYTRAWLILFLQNVD